jgi:gliding motility-associated-like protein
VYVLKDVFVPNAFSPNGDGLNDFWEPAGLASYAQYDVKIFNRYGQMVYNGNSGTPLWDGRYKGKGQPAGVYTYLISIKDIGATLKGWLMLVK